MGTLYILNGTQVILRTKGENGKHHTPHVHLFYSGESETMDFDGNIIAGGIDRKKHREIADWAAVNKVYLLEQWEKALRGEKMVSFTEWEANHK